MNINHRFTSLIFAFAVGLLVSYCSYQWVTNPDRAARRSVEEGVVRQSRAILEAYVSQNGGFEISDPLNRVREAGKVYIYPIPEGWEVSGQYRQSGADRWHPYLMTLDGEGRLLTLMVRDSDPALLARAAADPLFSVEPLR